MHKVRYIDFSQIQKNKEVARALDDALVAEGKLKEVEKKNNIMGPLQIDTGHLKMPFKRARKLW